MLHRNTQSHHSDSSVSGRCLVSATMPVLLGLVCLTQGALAGERHSLIVKPASGQTGSEQPGTASTGRDLASSTPLATTSTITGVTSHRKLTKRPGQTASPVASSSLSIPTQQTSQPTSASVSTPTTTAATSVSGTGASTSVPSQAAVAT